MIINPHQHATHRCIYEQVQHTCARTLYQPDKHTANTPSTVESPAFPTAARKVPPVPPTFGSFVRLHIVPAMRAARFFVSPLLSRSPLCTTGTTSARLGASIVLTKVVDSSVSRQSRVDALGSAMAARRAGTRADISGERMTLPTCTGDATTVAAASSSNSQQTQEREDAVTCAQNPYRL